MTTSLADVRRELDRGVRPGCWGCVWEVEKLPLLCRSRTSTESLCWGCEERVVRCMEAGCAESLTRDLLRMFGEVGEEEKEDEDEDEVPHFNEWDRCW